MSREGALVANPQANGPAVKAAVHACQDERREIGREAFVERVWQHLEETGRTIMGQFRSLGASLDYERERFTMDDGYVEAVMTFFVRLWDAGWIYRANRIVNWCPHHRTAISDLEVEHVELDDTLYQVRYPFADGDGAVGEAVGDDPDQRLPPLDPGDLAGLLKSIHLDALRENARGHALAIAAA